MQDFILSVKSSRLSQPSIGAFNNPAFGQDDKSLGFVRAEDNFECPRKMLFDPVEKVASIATISPDNGESLAYSNDFREYQRRSITIRYCSIGNCEGNDKAERINKQVALNAACLLGYIHTIFATKCDGFDRLTVNGSSTGFTLTSFSLASFGIDFVMDMLPDSILTPKTKIVIDSMPRRKIVRKHTPGAASSSEPENGIEESLAAGA